MGVKKSKTQEKGKGRKKEREEKREGGKMEKKRGKKKGEKGEGRSKVERERGRLRGKEEDRELRKGQGTKLEREAKVRGRGNLLENDYWTPTLFNFVPASHI